MQRKMSEKLVLVLPGLLLAAGLAFVLTHLEDQAGANDLPTFNYFVSAVPESNGQQDGSLPARAVKSSVNASEEFDDQISPGTSREFAYAAQRPQVVEYAITVLDEEGLPVRNARVEIIERSRVAVESAQANSELLGDLNRTWGKTSSIGELKFSDDRNSMFQVEVHVPGYASKRYRLLRPGRKLIQLYRNTSIVGTVYDPNGEPLPGVEVQIRHDLAKMDVTHTDQNGFYKFASVTPTAATIRINAPGFRRAHEHLVRLDGRTEYLQDFYLLNGEDLDVTVYGTRGELAQSSLVTLIELDTGLTFGPVKTNSSGVASFHCLEPEYSYLAVSRSGGAFGRAFVPRVTLDATVTNESQVTIQLLRGIFRGVVRADGDVDLPVEGVQVTLVSEMTDSNSDQHQVMVTTDANGNFTVEGLDPTLMYTAFLFHESYAFAVEEAIHPILLEGPQQERKVESSEDPPQAFSLLPPSQFEGQVIGKNGLPVVKGLITLDNNDLGVGVTGSRLLVRPDSAGRFSFTNLASGSYTLRVRDLGVGDFSSAIPVVIDNGTLVFGQLGAVTGPLIVDLAKN